MENLLIAAILLHVLVVTALLVHRGLRTDTVEDRSAARLRSIQPGPLSALPGGNSLEEYVQAGLLDLRIMLAQAARRHTD
jgi:hypothetical protein